MAEAEPQVLMPARSATTQVTRRRFYVALAALMTLLVFVGFWPSYYGPLTRGAARAPLILHVHGAIFIGWMALLVVQATLAARGRIRAHRALGNIGIGYGAVMWVVGLIVSFVAPVLHVKAGEWSIDEAAAFLPIPFGDMVLFGSFFAAAVAYRARPEIHKRLMLLATIAIVFAAAFRLQAAGVPQSAAIAIWYSPLVLAMAYDVWKRGRVHPVYFIGAAAMAVALLRLPFGETELWLEVGRPLFAALT
ncbi:MAG TPA: hypothetical protein VIQ99_00275 [Gammaproteobacteria bacterium]